MPQSERCMDHAQHSPGREGRVGEPARAAGQAAGGALRAGAGGGARPRAGCPGPGDTAGSEAGPPGRGIPLPPVIRRAGPARAQATRCETASQRAADAADIAGITTHRIASELWRAAQVRRTTGCSLDQFYDCIVCFCEVMGVQGDEEADNAAHFYQQERTAAAPGPGPGSAGRPPATCCTQQRV